MVQSIWPIKDKVELKLGKIERLVLFDSGEESLERGETKLLISFDYGSSWVQISY